MSDQPNGDGLNTSSATTWSDEDYIAALKHLHAIQEKIEDLRGALPNMITPLTVSAISNALSTVPPSAVYAEFAMNAMNAAKDIKTLRETWESDETRKLLQYAETSLDKNSDVDWEIISKSRWGSISDAASDVKDEQIKSDEDKTQLNGENQEQNSQG